MPCHKRSSILFTIYFSMLAALTGSQNAFAAQGQDLPDSIFALTTLEQAQKRGKMRRACISLSRKVATFSYAQQEMQGGGAHPITFERAYQKCLALSDDVIYYVPDNRTLTDALYKDPAAPTPQKVAFTITTTPTKASVRILNITPPYQAGMKLPTGLYHIVIQKAGFKKWDKWLKVTDKHTFFQARLSAKKQILAQKKIAKPGRAPTVLPTASIIDAAMKEAHKSEKVQSWALRVIEKKRAQKAALIAAQKAEALYKAMAPEIAAKEREVAAMERAEKEKYERAIAEGRNERENRLAKLKAMTIKTSLTGY